MLRHTFCHLPGISAAKEFACWESGIHDWEGFVCRRPERLSESSYASCCAQIRICEKALEKKNARFFGEMTPAREHWRLFKEFRDETAFLDIETTGLSPGWDEITTIALYDGREARAFVKGKNLGDFRSEIRRYRQIVTYNGKCFDVPFIQTQFGFRMDQVHLDLRYILASIGYKGGLKLCESALGIKRKGLEDVDGFMAVRLWQEYRKGNDKALETLLAYNLADAVNLETLMVLAYNEKLRNTPFADDMIDLPVRPAIPYRADRKIVKKLKSAF